ARGCCKVLLRLPNPRAPPVQSATTPPPRCTTARPSRFGPSRRRPCTPPTWPTRPGSASGGPASEASHRRLDQRAHNRQRRTEELKRTCLRLLDRFRGGPPAGGEPSHRWAAQRLPSPPEGPSNRIVGARLRQLAHWAVHSPAT